MASDLGCQMIYSVNIMNIFEGFHCVIIRRLSLIDIIRQLFVLNAEDLTVFISFLYVLVLSKNILIWHTSNMQVYSKITEEKNGSFKSFIIWELGDIFIYER